MSAPIRPRRPSTTTAAPSLGSRRACDRSCPRRRRRCVLAASCPSATATTVTACPPRDRAGPPAAVETRAQRISPMSQQKDRLVEQLNEQLGIIIDGGFAQRVTLDSASPAEKALERRINTLIEAAGTR